MITPRSLFIDEPLIERADLPPSRPIIEIRVEKKARQSCDGFDAGASSLAVVEDIHLARMQIVE